MQSLRAHSSLLISVLGQEVLEDLGALPLKVDPVKGVVVDVEHKDYNTASALRLCDKTVGAKHVPLHTVDHAGAHAAFFTHLMAGWAEDNGVLDEAGLAALRAVTMEQALGVFGRELGEVTDGGAKKPVVRTRNNGSFAKARFSPSAARRMGLDAMVTVIVAFRRAMAVNAGHSVGGAGQDPDVLEAATAVCMLSEVPHEGGGGAAMEAAGDEPASLSLDSSMTSFSSFTCISGVSLLVGMKQDDDEVQSAQPAFVCVQVTNLSGENMMLQVPVDLSKGITVPVPVPP